MLLSVLFLNIFFRVRLYGLGMRDRNISSQLHNPSIHLLGPVTNQLSSSPIQLMLYTGWFELDLSKLVVQTVYIYLG